MQGAIQQDLFHKICTLCVESSLGLGKQNRAHTNNKQSRYSRNNFKVNLCDGHPCVKAWPTKPTHKSN